MLEYGKVQKAIVTRTKFQSKYSKYKKVRQWAFGGGQPVLINFWASWCVPCRLEMPELKRVYEARQAEGFVVLAVNVTYQDSLLDVQRFVTEFELTFPVLLDETGQVADNLYYVRGLPTSIFVDRAGLVAKIQLGSMTGAQLDEFVGEILKE